MYGEFGRSHLAPFATRQHPRAGLNGWVPDVKLFDVIPRRIRILSADLTRRISCPYGRPVLVYTDARGEGQLGATVYVDGRVALAHAHVPE